MQRANLFTFRLLQRLRYGVSSRFDFPVPPRPVALASHTGRLTHRAIRLKKQESTCMPMLRTISCVEGRSQSVAKAAAWPGFSLIVNRSLMSPWKHEEHSGGKVCARTLYLPQHYSLTWKWTILPDTNYYPKHSICICLKTRLEGVINFTGFPSAVITHTYPAQWHRHLSISPSYGWCQAEASKSAQSWAAKEKQSYFTYFELSLYF